MRQAVYALSIFLAGSWASAEEPKTTPVAVPFELLPTKHIAVQVRVNGKGPYRVVFDTGAPIMLLGVRAAKESGVLGKPDQAPIFGMLGSGGQVQIKSLELGSLKAENIPTIVMDHPVVGIMSQLFGPIDGIVGFPFFARYTMTVDYQAKELTFVPNGYQPADALRAMLSSVMALTDSKSVGKVLAPGGQLGLVVRKPAGDAEAGVRVDDVMAGGSAAAAGIRAGDRLLDLDGRWTDTVADVYRAASYLKPGKPATALVKRAGKETLLQVIPRAGI
jgi:hypothetical protein